MPRSKVFLLEHIGQGHSDENFVFDE